MQKLVAVAERARADRRARTSSGARSPGAAFACSEALHAAAEVGERAFFFREVGDRQHDGRGVARPRGQRRADDDRSRRACAAAPTRRRPPSSSSATISTSPRRRPSSGVVAAREAEQLGAADVGRAIARAARDPRRRAAAPPRPARTRNAPRAARLRHELARAGTALRSRASATRARTRACPRSSARGRANRDLPVGRRRARRRCRTIGTLDAVLPVHPAVVQAAVVAHEELVDVVVRARTHAHDHVVARLDDHVAALRAVRADRRRAVELPRARLVQEVLREQRADRAEVDRRCPPTDA